MLQRSRSEGKSNMQARIRPEKKPRCGVDAPRNAFAFSSRREYGAVGGDQRQIDASAPLSAGLDSAK